MKLRAITTYAWTKFQVARLPTCCYNITFFLLLMRGIYLGMYTKKKKRNTFQRFPKKNTKSCTIIRTKQKVFARLFPCFRQFWIGTWIIFFEIIVLVNICSVAKVVASWRKPTIHWKKKKLTFFLQSHETSRFSYFPQKLKQPLKLETVPKKEPFTKLPNHSRVSIIRLSVVSPTRLYVQLV